MFAAGPERADEGGGPTPGDLEGNNVLRDHKIVSAGLSAFGHARSAIDQVRTAQPRPLHSVSRS